MATDMKIEVEGLEEAQRKAEQIAQDLRGTPFVDGMRRATLLVQRDAKILAPVDTGRLRASIVPQVRQRGKTTEGVVGTNVFYAPFRELGTKRHFVSGVHIGRWAERHGMGFTGLVVSGRATPFLRPAFEQRQDEIVEILGETVKGIVDK